MSRIIDLITPETINKTIRVRCGKEFKVNEIGPDTISGSVLFGEHEMPMVWRADGWPIDTKKVPENYHLRLVERKI